MAEGNGKVEWMTKLEASRAIGVSIRSIERLVEKGKVRQRFMKVVGRRPIAVLNPADVEKAKEETLDLVPAPIPEQVTALLPRAVQPDIITALVHSLSAMQGNEGKMFLTLPEASDLTGLSIGRLQRLRKEGKLPSIVDGQVKVRRLDLLKL